MAILAYVAGHDITGAMELQVTVFYFDDNDPLNTGVGPNKGPEVVLLSDVWTYKPTFTGVELQQALAADILARGRAFVKARKASADAVRMVPVGALLNVEA